MSTPVREGQKISYAPSRVISPSPIDHEAWTGDERQADVDRRLANLKAAVEQQHKLGTLDEIRLLLKSIKYGDMMKLSVQLAEMLSSSDTTHAVLESHTVAMVLHTWAVTDQVQDVPPVPRESLLKAAEEYRAAYDAKNAPRPEASRPAYPDRPAAGLSATSPTLPADEYAGVWPAARSNVGGKA
jgi:hypothetical protein